MINHENGDPLVVFHDKKIKSSSFTQQLKQVILFVFLQPRAGCWVVQLCWVGVGCCRVDGHGAARCNQWLPLLCQSRQVRLQARYDTRESTYSQDCEFFQCQGEPRPIVIPQAVAHRLLSPDGHDLPHQGCCPYLLPLHPSFMSLGAFAPSTGRQLGLHCGAGGAVDPGWGRGRDTFYPAPPCWAEAGPRVIARHYIDKICCPRYGHLAGRSLWAAGRHATCKLVGSAEGGECRKKHCCRGQGALEDGTQELLLPLLSQHHSAHWSSVVDSWLWLPSKVFTANIEYNRIVGHHRTRFKRIRNTGTANCDDPFNE